MSWVHVASELLINTSSSRNISSGECVGGGGKRSHPTDKVLTYFCVYISSQVTGIVSATFVLGCVKVWFKRNLVVTLSKSFTQVYQWDCYNQRLGMV